MTETQMVLLGIGLVFYNVIGLTIALWDIDDKGVPTPRDFYNDGYNWFGSWVIFIVRELFATPFYVIFIIGILVYKFIKWLLTARR